MGRQIILPRMLWYQTPVIKALEDTTTKYITFNASRRIGKSFVCKSMVVRWALGSKCKIGYIVPTGDLARKFVKEVVSTLAKSGVIIGSNTVDKFIHFANGSILYFHTAAEGAFSRGSGYDYLIYDEAAFFDEEIYTAVFKPMELQAKKVLIVSTPCGVGGMFYEMFNRGNTGDKRYKSFECTLEDSGLYDDVTIKEIKESTSKAIYSQEYMCKFVAGGISAFGEHYEERITKEPAERTPNLYAGIDFSGATGGTDSTVLTIVNDRAETVAIYSFQYGNTETLNKMAELLELWGVKNTYAEENSIGSISIEMMKKKFKRITPFQTTNQSKRDIVENVIRNFEQGKGSILDYPNIRVQFGNFVQSYSKTKKVIYANCNASTHDDLVISYCLAAWCVKCHSRSGQYTIS